MADEPTRYPDESGDIGTGGSDYVPIDLTADPATILPGGSWKSFVLTADLRNNVQGSTDITLDVFEVDTDGTTPSLSQIATPWDDGKPHSLHLNNGKTVNGTLKFHATHVKPGQAILVTATIAKTGSSKLQFGTVLLQTRP